MAHVAEELLALLKEVKIDERNLQLAIVLALLYAVDMLLADNRKLVLALVGEGKCLAIVLEAAC